MDVSAALRVCCEGCLCGWAYMPCRVELHVCVSSSQEHVLPNGVCLCVLLASAVCHGVSVFPVLLYQNMYLDLSSQCVAV